MPDLTLNDLYGLGMVGGGALLGLSSGPQQSGTITQITSPWGAQQQYLTDLFQRSQALMANPAVSPDMQSAYTAMQGAVSPALTSQASNAISGTLGINPANYYGIGRINPYTGNTTAPVTNQYLGAGPAIASNPLANQEAQTATNPYLGMDNPYLEQSVNNASQAAMRNLLPAYNAARAGSGSFGNSGVDDYFGRASADQLGSIANNAYMGQFNTNQQLAQNMSQFNTGAINAQNAQNQALAQSLAQFNAGNTQNQTQFNANLANTLGFGNVQRQQADLARNASLAQQAIGNDISQYNQGQAVLNNAAFNAPNFGAANLSNAGALYNAATLQNQAPWNQIHQYGSAITGNYGGSTTTPYYTNPTAGAIGGGLLGASLYGNMFGS